MTELVTATDGVLGWSGYRARYLLLGVDALGGGGEGAVWKALLPLSADGRRTVAAKVIRGVRY